MARIAGVDLPREKKVEVGLTYIFGIGRSTARKILQTTGVNADLRVRDLNDADVNRLRQAIEREPQPRPFPRTRFHGCRPRQPTRRGARPLPAL